MAKYLIHKAVETGDLLKTSALAQHLKSHPDYVVQTFWKQLKHDGCNCIVIWDPEGKLRKDGVGPDLLVLSRTGEDATAAMDHLREDLEEMQSGVYLGEAWKRGLDFPTISGIFRRKKPKAGAPLLDLIVFDHLTLEEWAAGVSTQNFSQRRARLIARVAGKPVRTYIHMNPGTRDLLHRQMDTVAQAVAEARKLQDEVGGYDGLIYRDPTGQWRAGDSGKGGEIIKVKPRARYTLEVTGYLPGKGKHEGKVGTLLVKFRGHEQGAGTGLKDYQREVADFRHNWLGRLVEVECLGVTKDGFLREPVLLGLRDDVLEADA